MFSLCSPQRTSPLVEARVIQLKTDLHREAFRNKAEVENEPGDEDEKRNLSRKIHSSSFPRAHVQDEALVLALDYNQNNETSLQNFVEFQQAESLPRLRSEEHTSEL